MAMDRLKQIKGFTTPEYLRETLIPKSKLGMSLPERFRKKGINTLETERMNKEVM